MTTLPRGPARRLIGAAFADMLALAALITMGPVFFTEQLRIPLLTYGASVTAAGLLGLIASVPLGRLSDRTGHRRMLVAATFIQAVAVLGYIAVNDSAQFIVATIAVIVAERAASAARGAFVAMSVDAADRVEVRGWMRAAGNVGAGIGTGIGAAALQVNLRSLYFAAIIAAALFLVVSAVVNQRLPKVSRQISAGGGGQWEVLRDRRYMATMGLNAVLSLHIGVFEVAIPLWITLHTVLPRWTAGAVFLVNTLLVVIFQVRISRYANDTRSNAWLIMFGGISVFLGFILFGTSASASLGVAAILLATACGIYTLGEMCHAAGGAALSYASAPDHAHGQYQAAFDSATQAGIMGGPLLATFVVIRLGVPGWTVVGSLIGFAGAGTFWAVRRGTI